MREQTLSEGESKFFEAKEKASREREEALEKERAKLESKLAE